MTFLHKSMPYRVARTFDNNSFNEIVAYFNTEERARDYIEYMNTIKGKQEEYVLQATPEDL